MIAKMLLQTVFGLGFLGAALFVPAGTLNYQAGRIFLIVLTVCSSVLTGYLFFFDRPLLERRMKAGPTAEKRGPQRMVMTLLCVAFVLMFIVAGLDYRFGWSHMPLPLVYAGDALIVLSYLLFLAVFRQNSFASATIEIAEDQKVISTGLYGIVRHPMYSGALLFMLGTPLSLASWWTTALSFSLFPALVWRIADEEKMLREELKGYDEYCEKVRFRLVPWFF